MVFFIVFRFMVLRCAAAGFAPARRLSTSAAEEINFLLNPLRLFWDARRGFVVAPPGANGWAVWLSGTLLVFPPVWGVGIFGAGAAECPRRTLLPDIIVRSANIGVCRGRRRIGGGLFC